MSRRTFRTFVGLVLSVAASQMHAGAADLYVIANAPLKLSNAELSDVFLGERQFANGQRLVVIDNAAVLSKFVAEACGVDAARYRTVWAKKGFREGLNPPLQLSSDREVAAIVRSTPGAIGYVSTVQPGVAVIAAY